MFNALPLSAHSKAAVLVMIVSVFVIAILSALDCVFYPSINYKTHFQINLKIVMTVDILLSCLSLVFFWVLSHIIFNQP